MELLDAFRSYRYPNEIGPGMYDIHSPRVAAVAEITELLTLARQRLSDDQLWVNPDCGLKTRQWEEVRPALINMVEAARRLRAGHDERSPLLAELIHRLLRKLPQICRAIDRIDPAFL